MPLIRRPTDISSSEITPESVYLQRREFIAQAGSLGLALAGVSLLGCGTGDARAGMTRDSAAGSVVPQDKVNSYEDITSYNNYYEFGTDKSDPKENAQQLRTRPWTVAVDGLVKTAKSYAFEDLVKPYKV